MQNPSELLTSLQFAVLAKLSEERSGRSLRASLLEGGIDLNGPAFYQLMARLVRDGFVKSRLNEELIRDLAVKETFYSVTSRGKEVWAKTLNFYVSQAGTVNADRRTANKRVGAPRKPIKSRKKKELVVG